ncbi:MAG: single-stranded DNA-binding protein [Acidimicrobiales bacterium]
MTNVVAIEGWLARPVEQRLLPSGTRLLALEVTVPRADGPAEAVPVAWFDGPAAAAGWGTGQEVVVVGRVRRRFFKVAGSTQSRTEVVADSVVTASARARTRRALLGAAAALETAADRER